MLIRGSLGAHPRGTLRGNSPIPLERGPRRDSTPPSTPSTAAWTCTPGRCTSACSIRRVKSAFTATCRAGPPPFFWRSNPSARIWSWASSACSAGTGSPTSARPRGCSREKRLALPAAGPLSRRGGARSYGRWGEGARLGFTPALGALGLPPPKRRRGSDVPNERPPSRSIANHPLHSYQNSTSRPASPVDGRLLPLRNATDPETGRDPSRALLDVAR